MDTKKTTAFLESIKKAKIGDFIYPGIIMLFLILTSVLFFFATQFISKNVNKVFAPDDTNETQALNIEQYKLVAKKLGIVVPTQSGKLTTTQENIIKPTATTSALTIEKKSVTIVIKNSTRKRGVETTLAKSIEASGFKKPEIGNEPILYATTTVFLKDTAKAYEAELLDIVHKSYPSAVATTSSETSTAGVTIIIGTH